MLSLTPEPPASSVAAPGHGVGAVAQGGDGRGGGRRRRVHRVGDRVGLERRVAVERDGGRGSVSVVPVVAPSAGSHGVADEAGCGAVGVGRQQAQVRVGDGQAGGRVDGGQLPDGLAGLHVDAGDDVHDEARWSS